MASQDQTYSSEFKAEVAVKAMEQGKKNLDRLSDEYDVPVSVILSWTAALERNANITFDAKGKEEAASLYEEDDAKMIVNVKTDEPHITASLDQGVMPDELNYKNLLMWVGLGLAFVLIFVQLAIEMNQVNPRETTRNAAGREYTQLEDQNEVDKEALSSFGVINLENGVYHVPIEKVIDQMATEGNTDMTVEIDSSTAIEVDSE